MCVLYLYYIYIFVTCTARRCQIIHTCAYVSGHTCCNGARMWKTCEGGLRCLAVAVNRWFLGLAKGFSLLEETHGRPASVLSYFCLLAALLHAPRFDVQDILADQARSGCSVLEATAWALGSQVEMETLFVTLFSGRNTPF